MSTSLQKAIDMLGTPVERKRIVSGLYQQHGDLMAAFMAQHPNALCDLSSTSYTCLMNNPRPSRQRAAELDTQLCWLDNAEVPGMESFFSEGSMFVSFFPLRIHEERPDGHPNWGNLMMAFCVRGAPIVQSGDLMGPCVLLPGSMLHVRRIHTGNLRKRKVVVELDYQLNVFEREDWRQHALPTPPSEEERHIILQLENYDQYPNEKCAKSIVTGRDGTEMTYEEASRLLLTGVGPNPPSKRAKACGYFGLAWTRANNNEVVSINEHTNINRRTLCMLSLHIDRDYAEAYNYIAYTLSYNETVTLFNRTFTEEQLYVEALRCNDNYPHPYNNLGYCIVSGTIKLFDGRRMTELQFYLATLAIYAGFSRTFTNLAQYLEGRSIAQVRLPDGRRMTIRDLLVESIRLDEENFFAYYLLAKHLGPSNTATLASGRSVDALLLLLQSIQLNPCFDQAYISLGDMLPRLQPERRHVILQNGKRMSQLQLYAEARMHNRLALCPLLDRYLSTKHPALNESTKSFNR